MTLTANNVFTLVKKAAVDWMNDHAPRLGAALAFYTIFSLAPLMTIAISIAGLWFSENASTELFRQIGLMIGEDNSQALQTMIVQPENKGSGIFTATSAVVMLFVGATGVFVQLQDSLNEIWEVRVKPGKGIMAFIRNRLLSFAAVLSIGFLLLVSLLLTAAIGAIGAMFSNWIGSAEPLWHAVNMVVSFAVITLLFAFMFKFLPDAKVPWRYVWFGAIVTSILFSLGKFALGLYLAKSSLASTYAAAGSLIVLLLWVYYSAQIVFFGAEITQAYAIMSGHRIEPARYAEKDEEKIAQTRKAAEYRDRKKEASRTHLAQPAGARRVGESSENGDAVGQPHASRSIRGVLLLALMYIPLEKWLFKKGGS